MCSSKDRTFMGLDLSTQQLKAVVVDDDLQVLQQVSVSFDTDLPEFRTHGGVLHDKNNPRVITAPTLMWVKALDMLMDRLTVSGVDYSRIAAISGTAQQHGTVYWQTGAEKVLETLDSSHFLHEQLATMFSVTNSPIWMDASTTKQCRELEEAVGGVEQLAQITGSRAYERFSGPQIAKLYQTRPDAYKSTERIALVSSFLCSLFAGQMAPIDLADASGMNLLDIRAKQWNDNLLHACAPDLRTKLGPPSPSTAPITDISPYYVERWHFNAACKVVAFTGDNAASLIGMRLHEGWLAVSLGTSDTLILWLTEPKTVLDGHVMCNPLDDAAYMGLLCFKNGSMTRERIRNACADGSWDVFNQLLDSTPRGNFGNMGLYYDTQEIIPFLHGDHRYNKANERVVKFSSLEVEVRAVVEGQFVARRAYAEDIGFHAGRDTKIVATGGGAANTAMLQVLADVFNACVYVQEEVNSAVLGAAYQAKHGLVAGGGDYEEITSGLSAPKLVCEPFPDARQVYDPMLARYRSIVAELCREQQEHAQ